MPIELVLRHLPFPSDFYESGKDDGRLDGVYRHGEMVTDHPHDPAGGWWWSRCVACGLGEAAHMATTGAGDRP